MGAQWLTAAYGLLTCLGAGTLGAVGVSEITGAAPRARRAASVAAALLCLAGLGALACALGRPQAVVAVAAGAAHGSPKSLEFVGCCLALVLAVTYAVVDVRVESAAARRAVGVAGLACGVLACLVAGGSSAVGRPGLALPLAVSWLGNGFAAGGALYGVLAWALGRAGADDGRTDCADGEAGSGEPTDERGRGPVAVAWVALAGVALQAVGFVAAGAVMGFSAVNGPLFWGGALLVGTVGAAACLAVGRRWPAAFVAGLACSAAGGACLRAAVLLVGTGSLNLIANAASRMAL